MKPAIRLSMVVLPQPEGPRTEVILPSSNVTETSRTAGSAPYCLRSRSSVMATMMTPPCSFRSVGPDSLERDLFRKPVSHFSGSCCSGRRRASHHLQPQLERAAPIGARDPLGGVGIALLERAQQVAAEGGDFLVAAAQDHGRH